MKNNLFISPHPDDVEIGCGGAIAEKSSKGEQCSILICTYESNQIMRHSGKIADRATRVEEQDIDFEIIGGHHRKKAAKEIKTIDDLSTVLNHLFTTHGNDLEYGYMIFDFNGRESMWLRMQEKHKALFVKLGDTCKGCGVSVDSVINRVVTELMADDTGAVDSDLIFAGLQKVPSLDNKFNAEDPMNE